MQKESTKQIMVEVERLMKDDIVKEIIMVENPLANGIKIVSGGIIVYLYFLDDKVEIFAIDKEGNIRSNSISF